MNKDKLKEIGLRLKEARESAGISLQKVSADLKIRPAVLEAIENGDVTVFPRGPYAVGFVKNYVRYLRLDESIIDEFRSALEEWYRPETHEVREKIKRYGSGGDRFIKRGRVWLTFVLILVVAGSVAFVWQQRELIKKQLLLQKHVEVAQQSPNSNANTQEKTKSSIEASEKKEKDLKANEVKTAKKENAVKNAVENTQTVAETNNTLSADNSQAIVEQKEVKPEQQEQEKPASLPKKVHVKIFTTGRCWVRVKDGDKVLFVGILQPGQEREFTGNTLTIRYGNTGAVRVEVNGKDLGVIGGRGRVAEFTYYPDGKIEEVTGQ